MVQVRRRWGTVLLALILAYVLLLVVAPTSQGQTSDDSEAQPPSGTSASSEHDDTPNSSNLLRKAQTERGELEVIRALAQGKSDRQIANALGISEKTVRNHTSNIYRKLHIFDRTQAVIYAIREGVIDVEELEYRPSEER